MRPVLLPMMILGAILSGCSGGETAIRTASNAPAISLSVITVESLDWPNPYEATGTVRARTTAVLSSKIMAYVKQVAVHVGDKVKEGEELVTLDAQDLDANVRRAEAAEAEVRGGVPEADNGVAAAKANLGLAQSTFRRMDDLASKQSISNQEFDEAAARLESAQAAYDMARAKRSQVDSRLAQVGQEIRAARIIRDYAQISAPFSGVVTAKPADPGNLALPGTPLLTIERDGAYILEAPVDESKLPLVRMGQPVEVSLDALDRRLAARISEIVPSVDAASRAYTVKIDLPPLPGLRSGMFGRVRLPMGTRNVIAVPATALVEHGQLQSVYVVEDGVARNRLITAGQHRAEAVEVLSGLSLGEKVVSPVPAGLTDGLRVEGRQ